MTEPEQDNRQRNQEIAKNEATRELGSDMRLSVWAIGLVVVVGLVVLAMFLKK